MRACYIGGLRRILAIVVMLVLGLPGLTPLFALNSNAEQKLPACCRRAGSHHCNTPSTTQSQSDAVSLSATPSPCPHYPGVLVTTTHEVSALAVAGVFSDRLIEEASAVSVASPRRQDVLRMTGSTRGPPASNLI